MIGTVLGDKEQGAGINDKGQGIRVKDLSGVRHLVNIILYLFWLEVLYDKYLLRLTPSVN